MKTVLLYIFLFTTFISYCQNLSKINRDSLNQYNSEGRKTGYWIQLLDKKWNPTKKGKKPFFLVMFIMKMGKI